MILRFGTPRLLPITIFALAGLLAMKSMELVRAATAAPETGVSITAPATRRRHRRRSRAAERAGT
jgi:hypothetical protein